MALLLSLTETTLAESISGASELKGKEITIKIDAENPSITINTDADSTDWIGIYRAGDSNDWGNVKLWTWVKNFSPPDWGSYWYIFRNVNLPAGEYEVRYFSNNTFTTRIKSKFRIASKRLSASYSTKNKSMDIIMDDKNFKPNPEDWIGVYRQTASNAWKNVKLWIWAKNLTKMDDGSYKYHFQNANLPSGIYRVRYFLNNTFITHEESEFFEVKIVKDNNLLGTYDSDKKQLIIKVKDKNFKPNPKDWFGIYAPRDTNDWGNVKLWVWAKDLKKDNEGYYYYEFNNTDIHAVDLEIRYFLNNTFITEKASKAFIDEKLLW